MASANRPYKAEQCTSCDVTDAVSQVEISAPEWKISIVEYFLGIRKDKARQQTLGRDAEDYIEENSIETGGCAMDKSALPEFSNPHDLQKGP